MNIDLSHMRNPVIGWDIQVTVKADVDEKIASARIDVNGFPEFDQQLPTPLNAWHKTLVQQGNYPGENKVLVTITNDKGEQTADEDDWE